MNCGIKAISDNTATISIGMNMKLGPATSLRDLEIARGIVELLQRQLWGRHVEFDSTLNIEQVGVSSLGRIELIVELERKFSIRFSDDQIGGDALDTMGGILAAVTVQLSNKL